MHIANAEFKVKFDRVLQKQDYNTTCLNENIKVLSDNDHALAQIIDRLSIQTVKKIEEASVSHGKEIVKVNSNLDIIKKQVWVVSNNLETLKKKPTGEIYKSTAIFSEPKVSMPYSITPTVESLIKTPGPIQFPLPDTMAALTPFANPSFFGNTRKFASDTKQSERISF